MSQQNSEIQICPVVGPITSVNPWARGEQVNQREFIHCGKSLEEGCQCCFKAPKMVDMQVEFAQQVRGTTVPI